MNAREKAIRRRLKDDFPHYAERCLKIRPKAGGLVPFRLNAVQRHIHEKLEAQLAETGRVRALILKARQPGCSTYVEGRFYWKVTHRRGVRAFILTHRQDATDNLFGMADRYHHNCPEPVRPSLGACNAKELVFDRLDSGYRVGTAGAAEVGRSETIQFFHGSEVAFWPRAADHMAGVLQAVPDAPGSEVILESTGNGIGGLFYNLCQDALRGEGAYRLIFLPWFLHEEYAAEPPCDWTPPPAFADYAADYGLTRAQSWWAWQKNAGLAASLALPSDSVSWKFRQEYPANANEAFQAGGAEGLIPAELVVKARAALLPDQSAFPLILGVDVARGGGDKTRVVDRQGRCMGHRVDETIDSADLMDVASRVARLIDRHGPDKAFIDVTGGFGAGVYDRLRELGYGDVVAGVNFGAAAADGRQYANKRAEMWGRLRDWLADPGGADIIDDDELHGDLCAPGFRHDSNSRLVLEPKDRVKERLGHSPDLGDAAALTFAETVRRRGQNAGGARPQRATMQARVLG